MGIDASLVETGKLNTADPQAELPKVLNRIVNGWQMRRISELMPGAEAARDTTPP